MARDYKPAAPRKNAGKGHPFLAGFMVGLVVGTAISAAVAILITGGDSPFVNKNKAGLVPSTIPAAPVGPEPAEMPPAEPQAGANRFDFYNILPGTESQVPAPAPVAKPAAAEPPPTANPAGNEHYFLQVGAFQTEQEADNVKAKLALLGMEAVIQTVSLDDKGVLHRVRVGPFTDIEQISKYRSELTRNGFNADLIKLQNNTPDQ